MEALRVDRVSVSYGIQQVLKNVSFGLGAIEKLALVGPNGSGKTTLLKVILGETVPDSGHVRLLRPATRIGYLPQVPELPPAATVGGLLQDADEEGRAAVALASLSLPERGGPAGGAGEAAKRFVLSKYGHDHPAGLLSGGERTRLGLACLWLRRADLLLLDEPTNHLDLAGLAWLAGWVRDFAGPVLLVSHDRYFLDEVATRVIALEDGSLRSYPGNYSAYRRVQQQALESQMALYREQEHEARRLRAVAAKQAQWFKQAHDAAITEFARHKAEKLANRSRATARRLAHLEAERVDKPRVPPQLKLKAQSVGRTARDLVVAEGLAKAFGHSLFRDASFAVRRGDRIGLVGPNGCGKTTLLRMMAGLEPADAGSLHVTPAADVAYLDQHAAELRDDLSVLEQLADLIPEPAKARTLLGSFLFRGDTVLAPVATLSGGERTRLALLRMLLSRANLLLLDEPTSYLDLPARERVEAALESYGGSLLLVSHDRYLLRKVCNKIMAIEQGRVVTYLGGYEEYAAKRVGGASWGGSVAAIAASGDRTRKRAKSGGAAGTGTGTRASDPQVAVEQRLLLENQLAVLSARLAGLTEDHPDHAAAVREFLDKARALRQLRT